MSECENPPYTEEWRAVGRIEGFAEVSNYGRLRSLVRPHPRGGVRGGQILKLSVSVWGYEFSCVRFGKGRKKNIYVHRVLAEAFIPNPDKLPQVNHRDGNKRNNFVHNLEWCTPLQNNTHARWLGLIPVDRSERPVEAYLGSEVIRFKSLTAAYSSGLGGIANISAVLHGRRQRAGGYHWRFVHKGEMK